MQQSNTLVRNCSQTSLFESKLVAQFQWQVFSWCGSVDITRLSIYHIGLQWTLSCISDYSCPFFSDWHDQICCSEMIVALWTMLFEPPTTKPTKRAVHLAKTQISLGICPVWSESSLSAWRYFGSLATHKADREDWSGWAYAQADLSSLGTSCFCRMRTTKHSRSLISTFVFAIWIV